MGSLIKICGLGPGDWEAVPVGVVETLRQAGIKFLRTEKHPVVPQLRQMGVMFETFDRLYEEGKSDDAISAEIASAVLNEAVKGVGQVIYAVPGHPLALEEPSRLIVEGARSQGIAVHILPAMSFLDAVYSGADPCGDRYSIAPLVSIIATLRGERGCPWDREQTHESLKKYLVEEAYEVLEAIEHGKPHNLCAELGDLLLQIVFHCQIAHEAGRFHLGDVVAAITKKMLYRHPHVFGQVRVRDSEEVKINWERLKEAENPDRRTFGGIPRSLPALLRAARVQEKASRLGFDWETWQGALTKVQEETAELVAAAEVSRGIAGELGDLIFAVVNVARRLGLDAEELLNNTTNKFINRFSFIEERAREKGLELGKLDLAQMDLWWEEAKKMEAGS
jgi:MazG family protein